MYELKYYLTEIGSISLNGFWFPLLIWTVCCAIAFMALSMRENLNPLFHYHLRTAALLSLPFGIAVSIFMRKIPEWFTTADFETAFFIVQNPVEIVVRGTVSGDETTIIHWMEPTILIGIGTLMIGLISLFMLGRLFNSYLALKSLYGKLNIIDLKEVATFDIPENKTIKLAFHDHPLVPFTFGWFQPVIVLPKILLHEPEKFEMALHHELVHIQRGDYLLQLTLSIINSVFWFHPLIWFGNKEIDIYREISCDQEVLSKSEFSIKSYANLLYELVPLSNGAGRLSVSMAVKNSTLKKRIKTMKYHKLHKASFRQSIAFLLLMIVGITLPIACSDLRAPQSLSEEELENTQINIQNATLTVNGVPLDNQHFKDISAGGLGAVGILAGEYGIFKVAPRQFDGGTKTGKIVGNSLSFKINGLNVELNSSSEILKGISNSLLWVSHNRDIAEATKKFPPLLNAYENANTSMSPPPPSPPSSEDQEDNGDYFVVVEEMPVLIGGMQALQSKIEYPELARRDGIEGRVTVQFIVNENGDVENAKVVRGIGGGADEEALKVVQEAKFEPGIQRGQPVRVRYALSINFKLGESDFSAGSE